MPRETVEITGLDEVLRRLRALGPEASKRGGPVRAAVRKGAVVIQKQAKANIEQFVAKPNTGGWPDESTGLMAKSVKPIRMKAKRSGEKGESYLVTIPRKIRYPISDRTPSGIPVASVAKLHEYGHTFTPKSGPMAGRAMKIPESKWMRNAFHAKKDEAAKVMTDEVLKGIARLEKKLART